MGEQDIALMAHLMRRAGFGATRDELARRAEAGYEATVEELLHPERQPEIDRLELLRYQPWTWKPGTMSNPGSATWLYYMVNTQRPLEEKMTLFWHQVFATGVSKVDHWDEIADMIDMFRDNGLGCYKDLLVEVAKSPAMIFWLDNNENHARAVNENWGRELLELFSMGVGSYTEDDVYECSRAFTGWTMDYKLPRFPYGRFDWSFRYRPEDHDDGEKVFLGETGRFNGEDVIDIICRQPATARFVARHLYSFFVADEVPVPAWNGTPPKDRETVDAMAGAFLESGSEMRPMLRLLFNSDAFKNARKTRVKSPAEVVAGTLRLVGGADFPVPGYGEMSRQPGYMGQELLNPPSVEGWQTGNEWITSGALLERVNFMSALVADLERPGVRDMVGELRSAGVTTPARLVDACVDFLGAPEIDGETRSRLERRAAEHGDLDWSTPDGSRASSERVVDMLKLVVSARELQLA